MRDNQPEWINWIPDKWEIRKIKNVASLAGRIGWQGLTSEEYTDDGAYLITGVDFDCGNINWASCVHIPISRWEEATQIQIKEGDLLITKDGTVGKVAIANKVPGKTSLNSGVLLIRNNKQINNRFLFWVLQSDVFWNWFGMINAGNSTIIHLYQHSFNEFLFPFPSITEQKRIVDYLDKYCSEIDAVVFKQEKLIEKLKEYKRSIISEAVTKGLNLNVSMKDSGVKWIGLIPSHWSITKMKYQGQFINGYAFPSSAFCDVGVRVLKIANIQPMRIDWSDTSYININDYDVDKLSLYLVKKNDLIFALTRPIINDGIKVAMADFDDSVYLNQRNAVFKGGTNISAKWQYYLMQNSMFIQEFSLYIDGTGQQPNISTSEISNITIPLPSLDEQKEITDALDCMVSDIDHKICCVQEMITKLTEYKKSLIFETVTGKMEV